VELGRIAEAEGADAVVLHPRTVEQLFGGRSDWSLIARMKSCLRIPVIGNGDICTAEDACRMKQETKCDGVMVGRAAMGNPWLFSGIRQKLEYPASAVLSPAAGEKRETVMMHLGYAVSIFGEQMGIRQFRNHLSWYARGGRGAVAFRSMISSISEMSEMEKMINTFFLEQEKGPAIAPEEALFRQISKLS
jgi:tRNA-dihydrouridine synthase